MFINPSILFTYMYSLFHHTLYSKMQYNLIIFTNKFLHVLIQFHHQNEVEEWIIINICISSSYIYVNKVNKEGYINKEVKIFCISPINERKTFGDFVVYGSVASVPGTSNRRSWVRIHHWLSVQCFQEGAGYSIRRWKFWSLALWKSLLKVLQKFPSLW